MIIHNPVRLAFCPAHCRTFIVHISSKTQKKGTTTNSSTANPLWSTCGPMEVRTQGGKGAKVNSTDVAQVKKP